MSHGPDVMALGFNVMARHLNAMAVPPAFHLSPHLPRPITGSSPVMTLRRQVMTLRRQAMTWICPVMTSRDGAAPHAEPRDPRALVHGERRAMTRRGRRLDQGRAGRLDQGRAG